MFFSFFFLLLIRNMDTYVNGAMINKMWRTQGLDGSEAEVREVARVVTTRSKYIYM